MNRLNRLNGYVKIKINTINVHDLNCMRNPEIKGKVWNEISVTGLWRSSLD